VGRGDAPTDAIREYCAQLGHAFSCKGIEFDLAEVSWDAGGWFAASQQLWMRAAAWREKCILLQYTALGWSRRGFPLGFLLVQYILRLRRVRFAIVYHDPLPFSGSRLVDRIRRSCQVWVMRKASRSAACVIVTIPPEKIDWLPSSSRVAFIPVGPNIPASLSRSISKKAATKTKTIGVFGVTGGKSMACEAKDIGAAVRGAKLPGVDLRVLLFGRNSLDAEPLLREELCNSGVAVEALGLLAAEAVTAAFSRVDIVLFVRGGISARRGSAIAAIANGLPIVAYEVQETSFPVTEAGVLLVPQGDIVKMGQELRRALSDEEYRLCLCERSRVAYEKYFSWTVIADSLLGTLASEP
jgi:glycosyltransferase involved in cell wall biosynthesis